MPKSRPPKSAARGADRAPGQTPRRARFPILLAGALVLLAGGAVFADWWICLPEDTQASYVGRRRCIECHQQQAELHAGSHHDLAMDRATPETVLGDFNDARLSHFGVESRMFRNGEKFMVHTEGPDGEMADFEVKYVFGVDPLQQYMVEFDRPENMPASEIARLQVLRISWDTHNKEWFYLSPPDVDTKLAPTDDLHWTGVAQRWNNMCADCHSTNLQKNFDVATRTYHTTFSEIDVSCEACHGPGSVHETLASANSLFWDRKLGYGLAQLKSKDIDVQIHTCAKCHSRRRIVHPDFHPGDDYYDYYANELLMPLTYHADGQILDEVYVYGSYLQSKMYHKGVRCTDCHDPHSARLIHQGNQVCTSCHQHPAGKYDSPAHHRHSPGSAGASCVECHMPETTYMEVDPRRDHSLRVPQPGLSVTIGTPNACTRCHLDTEKLRPEKRSKIKQYGDWLRLADGGDEEIKAELDRINQQMHEAAVEWWGEKSETDEAHWANVLHAARHRDPKAEDDLALLALDGKAPAIVRATALAELAQYLPSNKAAAASREALNDKDPQVRTAAVANLEGLPYQVLAKTLVPMLDDPARVVRAEAGRVLAGGNWGALTGNERRRLQAAIDELQASLEVNYDRAAAHLSLGVLYESMGKDAAAEQAYETAMAVEPRVTGPRSNLAALLDRRAQQIEQSAEQAARRRDAQALENAVKQLQEIYDRTVELRQDELVLLARDANLAPDNAFIQYRYGLSLYLHNQVAEAEQALLKADKLQPGTADFVLALALLYQKLEQYADALPYAKQVVQLQDTPGNRQLLETIRAQAAQPQAPTK